MMGKELAMAPPVLLDSAKSGNIFHKNDLKISNLPQRSLKFINIFNGQKIKMPQTSFMSQVGQTYVCPTCYTTVAARDQRAATVV